MEIRTIGTIEQQISQNEHPSPYFQWYILARTILGVSFLNPLLTHKTLFRRHFNVFFERYGRQMDIETALCANWVWQPNSRVLKATVW